MPASVTSRSSLTTGCGEPRQQHDKGEARRGGRPRYTHLNQPDSDPRHAGHSG
jgi:hypothetical protein